MKIIITENQYRRIIKEQGIIANLLGSFGRNMGPVFRGIPRTAPRPRIDLSKGPKPGFGAGRIGKPNDGVDIDFPNDYGYGCVEYKTAEEIVKELFDLCSKRSHNEEWTKIDSWVKRLRKSVSGLGTTSDFMKVLSEIKTLDELCAVVNRYPVIDMHKRGESLFDAISGEVRLSWMEIIKTLIKFIDELKIDDCKEYNYAA